MKKRLLALGAALLVFLGGCKNPQANPTASGYTAPTLPEFDESMSPQEHLEYAMEGLKDAGVSTVSYGSGWLDALTMSTGSADAFPALRQLVPNEDFINQFCAMGMMVIPSNDGTFRYQLSGLTLEEVCLLICGRSLTEEEQSAASGFEEIEGTVELGVDADRIFQSLHVQLDLDGTPWALQILIQR